MAKYLVRANCTPDGIEGVLASGGTTRSDVVRSAIALAVSSTGLASASTTVFSTAAEIDDATGRQVAYTPPGT